MIASSLELTSSLCGAGLMELLVEDLRKAGLQIPEGGEWNAHDET
jgi:hypothetical protein